MTVYIEKPAVNLREELASLRNQGGYQEQQFWYQDIVNGTFDSDTDWSKDAGWTIGSGVASYAPNTGRELSQTKDVIAGQKYKVTYSITSITAGAIGVYSPESDRPSALYEGVGSTTYTVYMIAKSSSMRVIFRTISTTTNLSIDNVSVVNVDANDDVIHTMPKGWKPKDVFEDGLLQREGAAHDYEVVYDGFDYYVKPAVAPSATTQTCVIGVKA